MIIHQSDYEKKEGWIPITKELPLNNRRVELSSIRMLDWNLETMEWKTQGWLTKSGKWSIKIKEGIIKYKSIPTHWKEIQYGYNQ